LDVNGKEKARFVASAAAELRGLGMPEAEVAAEAERQAGRLEARLDWIRAQFDRMKELDDAITDYWGRMSAACGETEDGERAWEALPDPPEWHERCRIEDAIEAVRLHDRWPRHLHFHGL
jgi:hypothetical protein